MATQAATLSRPLTPASAGVVLPAFTLWWREVVRFYRQKARVAGVILSPLLFWIVLGSGFGTSFRSGEAAGQQTLANTRIAKLTQEKEALGKEAGGLRDQIAALNGTKDKLAADLKRAAEAHKVQINALQRDLQQQLQAITAEPEVGKIYHGTVRKIVEFGAFVEIMPGTDGLLHISQISNERIRRVEDVLHEGDEINVKVLDVDRSGKIRLSMREAEQEPEKGN